jgi:glycosyltransferase involved in cell wall biosynthesis
MRPVVLIFLGHYLPGFKIGGPLRSILNLVDHLSAEFDFYVFTSDRDLGDLRPYPNVIVDRWTQVGSAMVYYASPKMRTLSGIAKVLKRTPHDLLYINSFFWFKNAMLPVLALRHVRRSSVPVVLAPRGEFSRGALALKAWKKKPYTAIAKMSGLLRGLTWQASTEYEAEDIRAVVGPATQITIARNLATRLPTAPPDHSARPLGVPLRVIFLSRISPKKNLDFALKVLARVRAPVKFRIYGPPEDIAYLNECKVLEEALPAHISVEWHDAVAPENVSTIIAEHDLFFFPTKGENFGHVIAEALGAGTPVLISDTTPWRNLGMEGVGNDFPLTNTEAFVSRIEEIAELMPQEMLSLRARAAKYARELQANDESVDSHRNLFFGSLVGQKNH